MGAPKQKWTAEEESALKAGVVKHGAGKWRTILRDPEFSYILRLRSNVDLKDKWRNITVTASGWGSRDRARLAIKRSKYNYNNSDEDESLLALSKELEEELNEEIIDAKPITLASEPLQIESAKKSLARLDNLILEAVTNLKEHGGSSKSSIAMYIEEQYWPPPDFQRLLSAKLKALTACGKLIKVKSKYRVAPPTPPAPKVAIKRGEETNTEGDELAAMSQMRREENNTEGELAMMRQMRREEAAEYAARAVVQAELAIAEAEEAAREAEAAEADAEAAEADAEAAQAFADAAVLSLKNRNSSSPMIQV